MVVSRRIVIVKHDTVEKTKKKKEAYLLQAKKASGELNENGNGNMITKNNGGIKH